LSGIGWFILKWEGKFLYFILHTCTCQAIWIECWLALFPYTSFDCFAYSSGQLCSGVHC